MTAPSSSPSVREIVSRLGGLRHRIRAIFTVVGVARIVVALVALLALFFVADRFLDLPVGVRRFVRLGLFDQPDAMPVALWLPLLGLALFLAIALTRSRNGAAALFAFIAGGIVGVYAVAIPWWSAVSDLTIPQVFVQCLAFMPGDLIKALLAAAVIVAVRRGYPLIDARRTA